MNSRKKIVGLTGLYCSGKSSVEKILISGGVESIDVDKIGHEALSLNKRELVDYFGDSILTGSGVDRKKLGKIVFASKKKLDRLNEIVHPVMVKKVEYLAKESRSKMICINASLLFEMGLNRLCDSVIIVKAPLFMIIQRALKRDGHSIFRVIRVLLSQKVIRLSKKNNSATDTYYINNDDSFEELEKKVRGIITVIKGETI